MIAMAHKALESQKESKKRKNSEIQREKLKEVKLNEQDLSQRPVNQELQQNNDNEMIIESKPSIYNHIILVVK